MLRSNVLLGTLLAVCVVFVTAAMAAPLANDQPTQSMKDDFRGTLRADLTIKSELSLGILPTAETGAARLGFCCGIRCTSSADCGGAACRPFITCCVRGTPEPSVSLGKSTRAGEEPAVSEKCK